MRLILLLVPLALQAQTAWRVSVGALSAANMADIASSRQASELNPLLAGANGQFSFGRAVLVKSVAAGSVGLLEKWALYRHPKLRKPFTILNFVMAGALSGVAVRNWRLRL